MQETQSHQRGKTALLSSLMPFSPPQSFLNDIFYPHIENSIFNTVIVPGAASPVGEKNLTPSSTDKLTNGSPRGPLTTRPPNSHPSCCWGRQFLEFAPFNLSQPTPGWLAVPKITDFPCTESFFDHGVCRENFLGCWKNKCVG